MTTLQLVTLKEILERDLKENFLTMVEHVELAQLIIETEKELY